MGPVIAPPPPLSAPSPAPSHGLATASLLDHDSGRLPYYVQSLLEKFWCNFTNLLQA